MRPHEVKNTIKSGIFIAILSLATMLSIFMIGQESSLFDGKTNYKVIISDAENLRQGAQVKLKGIKVGRIIKMEFENVNNIVVTLGVSKKFSKLIKEDSWISIKTQGMLGDKYLEILGGAVGSKSIAHGGQIEFKSGAGFKKFISQGGDILSLSTKVIGKMDLLLDQVTANNNIASTLESISKSSRNLDRILSKVEPKKIGSLVNNLEKMSTRINQGPGTMYSLIYDQSAYEELRVLLGGAQRNKVLKYFIRESIKNSEQIKNN